ncbi:MAG: alanine racemase [Acutalibacteraceae bacterium]
MSRIGFLYRVPERDAAVIDEIEDVCHMKVCLRYFYSFSVSDEGEPGDFLQNQFEDFMGAISMLKRRGIDFKLRHCSSNGAILDYPDIQLDMVRPGIILYGLLLIA